MEKKGAGCGLGGPQGKGLEVAHASKKIGRGILLKFFSSKNADRYKVGTNKAPYGSKRQYF